MVAAANSMTHASAVYVAGHDTFIGAALIAELKREGFVNLVSTPYPDLKDRAAVDAYFRAQRPEYVLVAAGQILGIGGNQRRPAELMFDNLLVGCHVIHSAFRHGVRKLLYLASGCIYPKHAGQPMTPIELMTGVLEPTSEFYATAKLANVKLCQAYRLQYGVDFISAIAANPFGPGDDFHLDDAHVIGALISRMCRARERGLKSVEVWGSGSARRDFIYIDDLAAAAVFVVRQYSQVAPINLSSGVDISIQQLAAMLGELTEFQGELRFDTTRPDGMPIKILDNTALRSLGWQSRFSLRKGLAATVEWFRRTQLVAGIENAR